MQKNSVTINDPLKLGNLVIKNRLYRAPVLEGAAAKDDVADVYIKAFEPNAKAGIGLIIQGTCVIYQGGQVAPGMLCVEDPEVIKQLGKLTDVIHRYDTKIICQLGHSGIFTLASWSKKARQEWAGQPLAPSPLPRLVRLMGHPGAHVLTTEDVYDIAEQMGKIAGRMRDAGYDGIQLPCSNAKLLQAFLMPYYNRREDEFGGSLEKRFYLIKLIKQKIQHYAGKDFPVLIKIPFVEARGGINMNDGLAFCKLAEQAGFVAITPVYASKTVTTCVSRGDFPSFAFQSKQFMNKLAEYSGSQLRNKFFKLYFYWMSKQYPFSSAWNRALFNLVKPQVNVPVFAVGGIRHYHEIEQILAEQQADMCGIGRPLYAEPELPKALLQRGPISALCENSNNCIIAQTLGYPGVCYNPDVKKKLLTNKNSKQV
ncbi:MAG: NADH:flavin oxidoreductase [Gammaproteobacteria bacterium]